MDIKKKLQDDIAALLAARPQLRMHAMDGLVLEAVPLRRIDFSGYGASTFSEWIDSNASGPAVTKVQFEASIGRTALEVIQVVSVIYPYCIQVVRTITMAITTMAKPAKIAPVTK